MEKRWEIFTRRESTGFGLIKSEITNVLFHFQQKIMELAEKLLLITKNYTKILSILWSGGTHPKIQPNPAESPKTYLVKTGKVRQHKLL
jgi:hypothetical protein